MLKQRNQTRIEQIQPELTILTARLSKRGVAYDEAPA